jgi:two-component system chemotaxis response regulator CheB
VSRRTVLIAERSPAVRAVLRRMIEADPSLRVVGEADCASDASELLRREQPEAVVMDVDLPGLGQTADDDRAFGHDGPPIVVVTSCRDPARSNAAFRAFRRRVVGVFAKPTAPARWEAFGDTLRETLCQIARDRGDTPAPIAHLPAQRRAVRWIAIGASTGGPAALAELLQTLGRPTSASIVVVQHIAAGFEVALAQWLAADSGLDVRVAADGERLSAGVVRLAPAGAHLTVDPTGMARLDHQAPPCNGHRPSVDVLFRSLLAVDPHHVVAVLLSGMGSDGVAAMDELRKADAFTLVQDEHSCAVWGMPRAARDRGAARLALPPAGIAGVLRRLAAEEPR